MERLDDKHKHNDNKFQLKSGNTILQRTDKKRADKDEL